MFRSNGGREASWTVPIRSRYALHADQWPYLMSFRDLKDPGSVIGAGPGAPGSSNAYISDLEAHGRTVGLQIGDERVRLLGIYVEPTSEPLTAALTKRLPWAAMLKRSDSFAEERSDDINRRTFLLDGEPPSE
jgi:hypothetical protein